MKRQKKKPRQAAAKAARNATPAPASLRQPTRRETLVKLRNWGLMSAAAGGGVWYLVDEVTATISEQDLSRIGNGIPAVVQIHDPRCSSCLALQRETRAAMQEFDDAELQYLVADITGAEGRALASAHGVGHITLLLFDGDGERRDILTGANSASILGHYFRVHADRYSSEN
jgi:hypothetical protein